MSYETNEAWKKENTTRITVRFMNSSGIPEALKNVEVAGGPTRGSYIIAAVKAALIRDGYLPQKQESAE